MIQPYTATACKAAIQFNKRLEKIVQGQLQRVKPQHHEMLEHASGFLYLDGMLEATRMVTRGKNGKAARRRFITQQREESILRLQEAGIIPVMPTWFSVSWFVLRWVIIPFIDALLDEYSNN